MLPNLTLHFFRIVLATSAIVLLYGFEFEPLWFVAVVTTSGIALTARRFRSML